MMKKLIPITKEIVTKIENLRRSTGLSPARIAAVTPDWPADFNPENVYNWLSGRAASGRQDHLAILISAYEEFEIDHVSTATVAEGLRAEKQRSGMSPRTLLARAEHIPDGLTPDIVDDWLKGKLAPARRDHIEFVLGLWRQQPDSKTASIAVTQEMIEAIEGHRRRTGVGFYAILVGLKGAPGLRPGTLYQMVEGTTKTIRRNYYESVLSAYEALPERTELLTFSPEAVAPIRVEQSRTGLSISRLVRFQSDLPPGFCVRRMQRFINGYQSTVPHTHYEYLLSKYGQQITSNKTKSNT